VPTEIARQLHAYLTAVKHQHQAIVGFDPLETRFPWPGQSRQVWPIADLSGTLRSGERFIIEVDDHADPARSVVKYWPLLHSIAEKRLAHPPIALMEVSRPDATFGLGFQLLAQFMGSQFEVMFPGFFRFEFVDLVPDDIDGMARRVLAFLDRGQGEPAV